MYRAISTAGDRSYLSGVDAFMEMEVATRGQCVLKLPQVVRVRGGRIQELSAT